MSICKYILVKGYVQGVSYRKQTARVARRLGVNGWVRNVSNGTVEACLEGEENAVDTLIAWCAFGSQKGKVDEVQIVGVGCATGHPDFSIEQDLKMD